MEWISLGIWEERVGLRFVVWSWRIVGGWQWFLLVSEMVVREEMMVDVVVEWRVVLGLLVLVLMQLRIVVVEVRQGVREWGEVEVFLKMWILKGGGGWDERRVGKVWRSLGLEWMRMLSWIRFLGGFWRRWWRMLVLVVLVVLRRVQVDMLMMGEFFLVVFIYGQLVFFIMGVLMFICMCGIGR